MGSSARVLNYSAGALTAKILFIGEAPGRLGADNTQIPFHGDVAGNNFEDLLSFAGISRSEIFVTNAVLCTPKDERGNNATPNAGEVSNCSSFLRRQIDLIDPKIVVTLGATALAAVQTIEPHGLSLRQVVRSSHSWYGRLLIPLYHPGQRAMIHRSLANQRSDYQFVSETLRRLDSPKARSAGVTKADALALAQVIIGARGKVSYFELHKLAYLIEYLHVRRTGTRLTNAYYIRQKDGPYCTDLQLSRLQRTASWLKVVKLKNQLILSSASGDSGHLFSKPEFSSVSESAVEDALRRYCYDSEAELKTAVYMTAPMRHMLRKERIQKINMYNAPIDFLAAR